MKRMMILALLVGVGVFAGSAVITPAMAHCGSCGVGDAPKKEKPCPACEKNKNKKDGEKCPACEAKKKKDDHGHDH